MSNIVLIYPNRLDECVISDATPANWSVKLPLTNIQNPVIKKVARTNIGVRTVTLKINLANQVRSIGGIAIINHNLTTNAKVRIEGFGGLDFKNSAGVTQTTGDRFDNGNLYRAYPIINPHDNGKNPFESRNWWLGSVDEAERKSYTPVTAYYPPDNQMCQSLRITITDTVTVGATSTAGVLIGKGQKTFTGLSVSNAFYSGQKITIYSNANNANFMSGEVSSCVGDTLILNVSAIGGNGTSTDWQIISGDNFLQIGRIIIGKAIEPARNPEYGDYSIGYTDLSEKQLASDNTKYFYLKPKMRVVNFTLKHLNHTEALSGFLDAQRELGLSGELLFTLSKPDYVGNINMPADKNTYANTFLCNFAELNPLTNVYVGGWSNTLKLEEIV